MAAAKFVIFSVFVNKKPTLANFVISPIFHKFFAAARKLGHVSLLTHIFSLFRSNYHKGDWICDEKLHFFSSPQQHVF